MSSTTLEQFEVVVNTTRAETNLKKLADTTDTQMGRMAKAGQKTGKSFDEQFGKKLEEKFSTAALSMGLVVKAIQSADKAITMVARSLGDMAPNIEKLNRPLSETEKILVGLKETMADKNLQSLLSFEGLGTLFGNVQMAEFDRRNAQLDALAREREFANQARMGLAGEGGFGVDLEQSAKNRAVIAAAERRQLEANQRRAEERRRLEDNLLSPFGTTDEASQRFNEQLEKEAEAARRRADLLLELENRYHEGLRETAESNAAMLGDIELRKTELAKEQSEERQKITEEEAALMRETYTAMMGMVSSVVVSASSTALDALFMMAEGQRVSFSEMAYEFLKNTGKQLAASGIQHELQALGMALLGDPRAGPMAALGAAEIGTGLAMMGGALPLAGASGGGAAGSGGGGGGGIGNDFAGGVGTGRRPSGGGGEGSDAPITVNLYGVLGESAGREITRAIADAKRKGRL